MNVVYLLQADEDGPVLLGTAAEKSLTRRINTAQEYNDRPLHTAELLDGDERLEHELHVIFAKAGHHVRGDWYAADAIKLIPSSTPRVKRDPFSDKRRLAAQRLEDRAKRRA